MRRLWFLLLTPALVFAINPNELKPCFERYDGFKIVDAVPFHSEWRMKAEEWCLEFCIRASSRCISIVYDKQAHICHYFNVNGIESEKIGKQPRMVYFQISERKCAEKMQNRIEQDDYWRNIQYLRQQQNDEANSTSELPLMAQENAQNSMESPRSYPETTTQEEEFNGDPMEFVKRFNYEKELEEVGRLIPEDSADKQLVKVTPETTVKQTPTTSTQPSTTSTTTEESTTKPPTTTTTSTTSTTTTTPTTTTTEKPTTTTEEPSTTTTTLPTTTQSVKSLIATFKAVRRPLPVELEKKVETAELRRSPVRSTTPENRHYSGKRLFTQRTAEAVDDESILTATEPTIDDCDDGQQEIWLAVENSQVNSSLADSVIKVASQPVDCMTTCQSLLIGNQPCDSFTFNEPAKRCIFHSSHSGFQVKPSGSNDFSTRAFRRFCYSESLKPFSDCAEFLAFRDYTLDIQPRELFEDLPVGNEGISACIELCVLSHDFRCKSASFNTKSGTCWIYDEHSLTRPENFKESHDPDLLYFENGCIEMPISADVRKNAKFQRIEPVLLDYRKVTKV
ncbi:hypothetical protein M3Y94_00918000 [Aphelenchoides besseyi]|nr:hypothetical protein M3Y94_00918000 [Aphelenchoides besseyi]KAI6223213.1 hypothetical protein M3Y95_00865700 [Aphelenchoides besseyi]